VSTSDVTTAAGCEQLIKSGASLGPVGGIFNFAVVLEDGALLNQTCEMFDQVLASKAIATQHLHEQSVKHCPELKHFVVYSSVSCGRGTPGQTNYGMANSVMERIIEKRHAMGLPAKAIQLGPIGDVGVLADLELKHKMKVNFDIPMQSIASLLEHHDTLLMHPEPILSCTTMLNKKGMTTEKEGFIDMLMRVLNIEDRKSISMNSTFSQLGIDSLAGVELLQLVEREYGVTLTASEFRSLTITELEAKVMENSKMADVEDEAVNYDEMDI
jgi:fatty acid synthase